MKIVYSVLITEFVGNTLIPVHIFYLRDGHSMSCGTDQKDRGECTADVRLCKWCWIFGLDVYERLPSIHNFNYMLLKHGPNNF